MSSIDPENTACLCNFIIQQQKYIENINNLSDKEIDKETYKEKENVLPNNLKKLCDVVNIEYETIEISNMVMNNIIYYNGKKKIITDNISNFGWLIIVNDSYILNHYVEPLVEWCLIYNNIVDLAKEYSSLYFHILSKGLSHTMSIAFYYATITTINLNILINDELYNYIRKFISFFSDDEKKLAIREVSNLIILLRLQK